MTIQPRPPVPPRRPSRSPLGEAVGVAAGGLSLGAPAAMLGYQLGERYGMRVVQACIPHALELMQSGWLSPQTALNLAQYALRPVVQAQVGALLLGSLGVVVGAAAGASLLAERI